MRGLHARDSGFEGGHLGAQVLEIAQQRVEAVVTGHAVGIEIGGLRRRLALDGACRDADDGCVGGHGINHDGVGADPRVVADRDGAEDLRAGADDDVVANGRVTLAAAGPRDPERHLMIKVAIIAHLGGFTDDDAHAMINDEAAADDGGGVDFDAGQPAREVRRKPPQKIEVMSPQPMRQAMPHDGMHARVAEQDFKIGTRRWVALAIGPDGLTQ